MTAIVDTSILFAFYSIRDKYHLDSLTIVAHMIEDEWERAYVTNHILDKILTLLKYRISPKQQKYLLNHLLRNI